MVVPLFFPLPARQSPRLAEAVGEAQVGADEEERQSRAKSEMHSGAVGRT